MHVALLIFLGNITPDAATYLSTSDKSWLIPSLEFQEAISHLQALEDELVEAHRATIQNMLKWTKEDASLLAMTNEVDYDQDGKFLTFNLIYFLGWIVSLSGNIKMQ